MNKAKIEMGCGKGTKCSIGCYILPQGLTKEAFSEYIRKQSDLLKEHSQVDTHIEVGGDKF